MLRAGWNLNDILGDGEKNREDHRQHAIDAVVIALTDQRWIKQAADLAEAGAVPGERFYHFLKRVAPPWDGFHDQVRDRVRAINVSHRPTHRLAGPLHAETFYSRHGEFREGKKLVLQFKVRKSLDKLKETDFQNIIDERVREAVQRKFQELCAAAKSSDRKPDKLWSDRTKLENFPFLPPSQARLKTGAKTCGSPIFKVRLLVTAKPRAVGVGHRQRYVDSGKNSNFASMIYEIRDRHGKFRRWRDDIITRLDAHQLLARRRKLPLEEEKVLVPKTAQELQAKFKLKAGETVHFLFALRRNDMLLLQGPEGADVLYRVQRLSQSDIQLCEHYVPTIKKEKTEKEKKTKEISGDSNRISSIDSLRERNVRVVKVSPLGTISLTRADQAAANSVPGGASPPRDSTSNRTPS
jgi:CRISPR-associated endonuclease Csn1